MDNDSIQAIAGVIQASTSYSRQDIIGIVQAAISFVGLIAIGLLWWQIRSDFKWKRINMSLDKLDMSLYQNNINTLHGLGIDMNKEEMSKEEFEKITAKENINTLNKVTETLNMFNELALLYNLNVLNKYVAYDLYSKRIILTYLKFKRIIEFHRDKDRSPFTYKNFEKCAKALIKERDRRKENVEKLTQKVGAAKF